MVSETFPKQYFSYPKRQTKFKQSVEELIHEKCERIRIPTARSLNCRNGSEFSTSHTQMSRSPTDFISVQVKAQLNYSPILNHDISELNRLINQISHGFASQITKNVFDAVADASAHSGNTVAGQSIEDSFISMLERVEFGVDDFGRPRPPSLYAPPELAKKFYEKISAQTGDYAERVNWIIQRKEADAIKREATRISRFRVIP